MTPRVLLLDNKDSFVWNLARYVRELGAFAKVECGREQRDRDRQARHEDGSEARRAGLEQCIGDGHAGLDVLVRAKVNEAIAGGYTDSAQRSRFGSQPATVRR